MVEPTFNELVEPGPHSGPQRTPVLDTPAVTNGVVEWFQNKSQWRMVETEMCMPVEDWRYDTERRADVVAFNYTTHEFYIVEVKTQWNDFTRDRKFPDYRKWCNWFAFAMPEELIACAKRRMDATPGYEGVGLLVIPNNCGNRHLVRRPKKYEMPAEDYLLMVERWGRSCWGRTVGARQEIAELKWRVNSLKEDLRPRQSLTPRHPSPE